MKKILITFVTFFVICFSIWFQSNFLNSIPLAGVIANLGIVLIAGVGLVSGKVLGGVIGFVYGLLIDITIYQSLGLYVLLYSLTGIIAGFLNHKFSKDNKISMIMLILFTTIIFESLLYLFNVLVNRFEFQLKFWFFTIVLETMYNILLTVLFYRPITFLGDLLNRCKNSYYLL